jgi:ATP-dependent DNA helicase RecG
VRDLILHLPFRYEDRRGILPVAAAVAGSANGFRGRLVDLRRIRTRHRGMTLVRGFVEDGSGRLPVVWFNRPYLANPTANQTGDGEHLLYGPVKAVGGGVELVNPSCELAEKAIHGDRIAAVYPAAGKVGPAALRRLLDGVLQAIDLPNEVPETVPAELLQRHGLLSLGDALQALHHPADDADVDALNGRRAPAHLRLIYGELLELQVALALRRQREEGAQRTRHYRSGPALRKILAAVPPFPLTAAQERVTGEILEDLARPHPMLRLLQGDVGSGKTIVAALALAAALESGYQAAFMAPTELLAEQHFASLSRLLGERHRTVLLTGSAGEAGRARAALASGEARLAVGTHALLQETVGFRDLGLIVVDEQHRFGVAQRELLRGKGSGAHQPPDMLMMTATPIPRSLALTAYGDLPVSTLDELPPGRSPVATHVVPGAKRRAVYRRLRAAIEAGAQAYVVAPLIEESARGAASLAEVEERVREALTGFAVAVVHGRMPAAERERALRAFAAGEARALVATTVIEVGLDVPGATWMVIESAERFGLAQLHQLRGRIGRGTGSSTCVAIHDRLATTARERLDVFATLADGFEIAERDLALRGPGDLLGTRQAGLPALKVARLPADWEWLVRARDDARELLGKLDAAALRELERVAGPRSGQA